MAVVAQRESKRAPLSGEGGDASAGPAMRPPAPVKPYSHRKTRMLEQASLHAGVPHNRWEQRSPGLSSDPKSLAVGPDELDVAFRLLLRSDFSGLDGLLDLELQVPHFARRGQTE